MSTPTADGIRDALADLDPDIADRLLALGITGTPNEPDACPVANYLATRFPGHEVYVACDAVEVGDASIFPSRAIADFINSFDTGDLDIDSDTLARLTAPKARRAL